MKLSTIWNVVLTGQALIADHSKLAQYLTYKNIFPVRLCAYPAFLKVIKNSIWTWETFYFRNMMTLSSGCSRPLVEMDSGFRAATAARLCGSLMLLESSDPPVILSSTDTSLPVPFSSESGLATQILLYRKCGEVKSIWRQNDQSEPLLQWLPPWPVRSRWTCIFLHVSSRANRQSSKKPSHMATVGWLRDIWKGP